MSSSVPAVRTAAAHLVLDRMDQDLAIREDRIRVLEGQLRDARDVVRRFLEELERKDIDLRQVLTLQPNDMILAPQGPVAPSYVSVDDELLIQLRDLVRKP